MNSYSIGINGEWWILAIVIVIGILLTFYTYKLTIPVISKKKKGLLITLRILGLSLLIAAIFEPVMEMITAEEEKAKIAVLFDNSKSLAADDALGSRQDIFQQVIEQSDLLDIDQDQLKLFSFDNSIKEISDVDSMDFSGQVTDISQAIRWVSDQAEEENIQSVVVISDGAYNYGNSPIYDGEIIGKPIYTIGIGDSTLPKDIAIQSIITNDIAYVDHKIPVNINLKINGYKNREVKLVLKENGIVFKEEMVSLFEDKQDYNYIFEYEPKTEGSKKITAEIDTVEDEITDKNNIQNKYIKVLKNKKVISIFAGAPSSDLSFVYNQLSKEKGIQIKQFIQKKANVFYSEPTPADINTTELFIFIGFPIKTTSTATMNMIKKGLQAGKPLLLISSLHTDYNVLSVIKDYIPFNIVSTKQREYMATPHIDFKSLSSPLLRLTGTDKDVELWNKMPPVFRTETFVRVKPGADVVAKVKVNDVALNEPMIISRSFQNSKVIAILSYGLYRWKLLDFASEQSHGNMDKIDVYTNLINNCIKWLSVDLQNKLVNIKTDKKLYTSSEKVNFIAQVYDESYNPIDNAEIDVNIKTTEASRDIKLISIGNGRYRASINGFAEGDFFYNGLVKIDDRNHGKDNGRFSVGDMALEYQNLHMNASLLRMLSARTGGKFYANGECETIVEDIQAHKGFKSRIVSKRKEIAFWNLPFILGLAIFFFALEWFIRKRASML